MTRIAIADVCPVDWSKAGPLFEVNGEDGPEVRAPDPIWIIQATTAAGEVYNHPVSFPIEARFRAERFARRVSEAGSIDPEIWDFYRTVYGSEAGQAEEFEACLYAESLRRGGIGWEDIPENFRTWL